MIQKKKWGTAYKNCNGFELLKKVSYTDKRLEIPSAKLLRLNIFCLLSYLFVTFKQLSMLLIDLYPVLFK